MDTVRFCAFVFLCIIPTAHTFWGYLFGSNPVNCTKTQFRCNDGVCLDASVKCNRKEDCKDAEDEENCNISSVGCQDPNRWFECDNKECILLEFVCDRHNDCDDNSDEANCTGVAAGKTCSEESCDEGETCLSRAWICDGVSDCRDDSDEQNCTCQSDEYKCPNSTHLICIPEFRRCDGVRDCDNGADEYGPECEIKSQCMNKGRLLCKDGKQCIEPGLSCDNMTDCRDGSDETSCDVCIQQGCEHGCVAHPNKTATCVCRPGYRSEQGKHCKDINECEEEVSNNPICSQGCENKIGSYRCLCMEGYKLDEDGRRCKIAGREPVLVLGTPSEIRLYTLRTKLYNEVLDGFQAVDIAVDSHKGRIFWTDGVFRKVFSIDQFGNKQRTLISNGLDSPAGLSYDWINDLLYIVDTAKKLIYVCSADGETCTVLLKNLDNPVDIVVDPISNLLYWTDLSKNPTIMYSTSDGSDPSSLLNGRVGIPQDLVMDYTTNCLYWINMERHNTQLERHCFGGPQGNREIVLAHSIHNPRSLTIVEDFLFWSSGGRVVQVNKFTGLERRVVKEDVEGGVFHLDVIHPSLQPEPTGLQHPCIVGPCSHICLPSKGSYRCACPTDLQLDVGSTKCVRSQNATFILIGVETKMLEFSVGYLGSKAYREVGIHDIKSMYLLDFDPVNQTVIFSDRDSDQRPIICSASILPGSHIWKDVIVNGDIMSIEGLAVDWIGRNVFWIDSQKKTIEVARLDNGSVRAIVTDQSLVDPHGLVLHLEDGLLFYADWGEYPHIQRCDMDATNCEIIGRGHHVQRPNCLTLDPSTSYLYWSDLKLNAIYSMFIDGDEKQFLVAASSIKSIIVNDNILFWTDGRSALHMTDLSRPHSSETDHNSPHGGLTGLTMISSGRFKPVTNACSQDNGGCSHICLAREDSTVTCKCPTLLSLAANFKTCYNKNCSEGEILCVSLGQCLSNTTRCDGVEDCPDRSDEEECPEKCEANEYQCKSGNCIWMSDRCDGIKDCSDWEDEHNCSGCSDDKFSCDKTLCILKDKVCDHYTDCNDGTDEENCPGCDNDHFTCADNTCITVTWMCDGDNDCEDGEDEKNCSTTTCDDSQFACDEGRCLSADNKCDGVPHCHDGSDEMNCTVCPPEKYQCVQADKEGPVCVDKHAKCDGREDCPLGDDEKDCPVECSANEFKCLKGNLCIADVKKCNGKDDCRDGSDEDDEQCNKEDCGQNMFQCQSGQCIEETKRCDSKQDCPDGSDEPEVCNSSCKLAKLGCSHNCTMTDEGAKCTCYEGFYLADDGKGCLDIDECHYMNGVCGQVCKNKKGGYSCHCVDGYELARDGHTCKAEGRRPYLLLATNEGVTKFSLAKKLRVFTIKTKGKSVFVDALMQKKKMFIFWSQEASEGQNVSEIIMYASSPHPIIRASGEITGMTVDWLAENLYYTKYYNGKGSIIVCVIRTPSVCRTLVENPWKLSYIALHPAAGLMFWIADKDGVKSIVRSRMDGMKQTKVVKHSLQDPVGLVVDAIMNRVYWTDTVKHTIGSATIEGKENVVILKQQLNQPFAMDFFENSLFLSEHWSLVEYSRFKEVKFRSPVTLMQVMTPRGLKVVHEVRQKLPPGLTNPCESVKCSQLCVLTGTNTSKCVCEDIMIQNLSLPVGQQCQPIPVMRVEPEHEEHEEEEAEYQCQNGGTSRRNSSGLFCLCGPAYTGYRCEVALQGLQLEKEEEENKAWVAGVVLAGLLVMASLAALVYFIKIKRRDIDLVSIIKFRNPAFRKKDDEAEELVPDVSFGNPGFQDFDDIPDQDWLTKIVNTSRISVDSAFASRQNSFVTDTNSDPLLSK